MADLKKFFKKELDEEVVRVREEYELQIAELKGELLNAQLQINVANNAARERESKMQKVLNGRGLMEVVSRYSENIIEFRFMVDQNVIVQHGFDEAFKDAIQSAYNNFGKYGEERKAPTPMQMYWDESAKITPRQWDSSVTLPLIRNLQLPGTVSKDKNQVIAHIDPDTFQRRKQ